MPYLNSAGAYHEGDREHSSDFEVPQRPSDLHTWDSNLQVWVIDAKVAVNAPLDARMATLEAASPPTLRAQRELALTLGQLPAAMNTILAAEEAAFNRIITAINTATGSTTPPVAIPRLPDLMGNEGMVKALALEMAVRALRAQRVP